MSLACNVCQAPLGDPLYESRQEASISSLSKVLPFRTRVYACPACGHLQTPLIGDLAAYYDTSYRADADTDDSDQLVPTPAGPVFRSELQARVVLDKVPLPPGAKVLDYGCGKAMTLRRIAALRPDIAPYAFDVTDMYRDVWGTFTDASRMAAYEPDAAWYGTLDLVTSFFALEHVADPSVVLDDIARLLKPGGCFYGIVPHWRSNIGDLIVVDHVQHFWTESLRYACERAGLAVLSLDADAHAGAIIVEARRAEAPIVARPPAAEALAELRRDAADAARFWLDVTDRVRSFERAEAAEAPAAIYGAGVYGRFVASCLDRLDRVTCFVDRSRYQQGKSVLGRPVLGPEALPDEVRVVYVGLNPRVGRAAMQDIGAWQGRPLRFFHLG